MKKSLLTLLMIMSMLMTCAVALPTGVLAATDVPYLDADGNPQTVVSATKITNTTDELTAGWYVVNGDVTRTETITVTGDVHLILADGCNLTVTGAEGKAGININGTNSLTIYNQSGQTGVMNITGGQNGAGIGSGYVESGGFITINGGIINATGGDGDYVNNRETAGAGIGDGGDSHGIKIIINGGKITATGGGGDKSSWTGAGIGGWKSDITITGGNITAKGGENQDGLEVMGGAGIGGSGKSSVNTITISGGTVTATGGPEAAGIGGGQMGVGGIITISGGAINATGGNYTNNFGFSIGGAGIGSGVNPQTNEGETTITISGTSTVTATGAFFSAGIGTGAGGIGNHSATITIDGGTVTGIGGVGGAGIGGGNTLDGGTITIKNGTIIAIGGESITDEEISIFGGAGIGGGGNGFSEGDTIAGGNGGTINISGGLVFAKGNTSAKDIGGGPDSSGGSLAISGTAAVFLRNDSSVEPVDTTTHTHKNISNHVANTTAFGIPVSWDGGFGAWLVLSTITFDSAGGSKIDPISQVQGTAIVATTDPTREGYTFDGWSPVLPETMPAEDLLLTAKWIKGVTKPEDDTDDTESTVDPAETPKSPQTSDPGVFSLLLLTGAAAITSLSIKRKK